MRESVGFDSADEAPPRAVVGLEGVHAARRAGAGGHQQRVPADIGAHIDRDPPVSIPADFRSHFRLIRAEKMDAPTEQRAAIDGNTYPSGC
jgi:hypothetical protein